MATTASRTKRTQPTSSSAGTTRDRSYPSRGLSSSHTTSPHRSSDDRGTGVNATSSLNINKLHASTAGAVASSGAVAADSGLASPYSVAFALTLAKSLANSSKQTAIMRSVSLSRYFQVWRSQINFGEEESGLDDASSVGYFEGSSTYGGTGGGSIVAESSSSNVQKQNYLKLFAENEKLREQLSDVRKSIQSREKSLRAAGGKSIILIYFRSRLRIKVRALFDRWCSNTQHIRRSLQLEHKTVELDIGLQHVESNLSYIRDTERANLVLQRTLACVLYFMSWKSKAGFATLTAERKIFNEQKKQILLEVLLLKDRVTAANRQEAALLSTTLARGDDVVHCLERLKASLARATRMNRSLNDQLQEQDKIAEAAATAKEAAGTQALLSSSSYSAATTATASSATAVGPVVMGSSGVGSAGSSNSIVMSTAGAVSSASGGGAGSSTTATGSGAGGGGGGGVGDKLSQPPLVTPKGRPADAKFSFNRASNI